MRLLFVVHQFLPEFSSGTELVTLSLAQAAQRAGHRADILTRSMNPAGGWYTTGPEGFRQAAVRGLAVSGIPDRPGRDIYGLDARGALGGPDDEAVDRFLVRGDYDLVHVTHAMRMLDVTARLRMLHIPYVLTLTDFFLLCYRINLLRLDQAACAGPAAGRECALRCAQGVIDRPTLLMRQAAVTMVLQHARMRVACSEFVATAFRREHPDLSVRVIGHGIDLLRTRCHAGLAWASAGAGGGVVFGHVGTLSRAKGIDVLARAFSRSQAADIRLELIGPIVGDVAFERDLAALAAADSRIHLRGRIDASAVPAALAKFDVFCLPTRLPETFSLALHEAFAAGLPALVSDLGHPAALLRQAGCGDVLPSGDVAAWHAALEDVATHPGRLASWRARLPLPTRVEEEAFLYSQLYRACIA